MKMTLLKMTQQILRSLKGEQVDDITETEESSLVADIIEECYYSIVSESDLLEEKTLFELLSSTDPAKPVTMSLPDDVIGLEWVEYDTQTETDTRANYRLLTYYTLRDFLDMTNQFNTDETFVETMTLTTGSLDTIDFKYRNDKAPEYYTSFDDRQLVFDSYDSAVDSTLQKNKTKCFGLKESKWRKENDFVPAIDAQQFNLLYQEAKATAWAELKLTSHQRAERKARRSWVLLNSKKDRVNYNQKDWYYNNFPNYGRK